MNNVIPFRYRGELVSFNSAGWVNATEVARRFGKRPIKWLELPSTKSYMAALERHLCNEVRKSDFKLVETVRGRGAATWLHPKLAVAFARWLDDDFAVWCDLQIDALLRGEESALAQFNRVCLAYDQGAALASAHGTGLSLWKHEKPRLLGAVERVRSLLQMTLALE
ncbi:KilA-N domain-containing protein [Pseudomonas aeruginosa]|uniref:KilA-N domain-containing protein n=1 Tax=Pseudomonas aeruginosa TaxID=287 RepID=UPI001D09A40A|nr:KilA-N domain-containing protein [Pseudomonas aeruginosa]MCC0441103.1 KilA-N domain-containing protein [Pseudomonas aeruginosa]